MNKIDKGVRDNINTYYLYKLLSNSTMRGPILILFMTKLCGMPLAEVFFCEACCVILLVILQIPTGILADRWGRAKTVRIGCLILIAELICFASATDHTLLWIGNALWAIGYSFVSGADSALIYDSLKLLYKDESELEAKYRNIEGKSSAYFMAITAIMCLISGYIAEINMRLPVIIDMLMMTATLIVSFYFVEPEIHSDKFKKLNYWDHMNASIAYVVNKKHILWIISFTVLIGVTSKLWFFTYNPYFEMVGLDLKYFGFVFFLLNIVAGVSGYFADQLSKKFDGKSGIIISIGAITVPMIIMGTVISKWSILLVLFQNLVRGYLGPFVSNMLHKQIESSNRATILSVKSAMHQAVEVLCMAMFASLISSARLGLAITLVGVISSILGIILTYYYVIIFNNEKLQTVTSQSTISK